MDFTEFNLHESLMKGIEKAGYKTCTPVQEQVLKAGLTGDDLYVQSQTGTGKTAAYLTLMLQQLLTVEELKGKKALIMVPTRELAVQVEEEAKMLAQDTELKTGSFYGGVGYEKQTSLLKKNVDILVGTPGRVIDLEESGTMNLSQVAFLVVDEADRMFDMGFYPDLRKLIKVLPATDRRQTMLFSATLNTYVKNLAWEYTEDAKEITIEPEHITIEEIDQVILHVSSDDKMKLLLGILKNEKPKSVIIFCNTKRSCEVIAKRLKMNEIEAEFIIGDLPQSKRLKVLESFKQGELNCLVATDVAARGIDVNDLEMVVNYDLPNEAENYVHRIGRTARAGKSGKAYTLCSEQDVYNLPAIERYVGNAIPASMASEEMFIDDVSSGVYIKTERYEEEYSDRYKSRRDGRRGSDKHRGDDYRRSGKRDSRYDDSRKKDSRSSYKKNDGRRKPYNRSSEREEISEELAAMSFEDRMKLYKEKYGSGPSVNENQTESVKKEEKKKAADKKKNNKKKRTNDKYSSQAKHPSAPKGTSLSQNELSKQNSKGSKKAQVAEKPAKKGSAGILGLIQRFFGNKKEKK
ncbi:MAG: DEAD/DEAH box helicase [Treponemataceae bacterium]|nr:DEAD/DEAH box helicase [Treponemataceae bacterium]